MDYEKVRKSEKRRSLGFDKDLAVMNKVFGGASRT